jgi:hypothetical protein
MSQMPKYRSFPNGAAGSIRPGQTVAIERHQPTRPPRGIRLAHEARCALEESFDDLRRAAQILASLYELATKVELTTAPLAVHVFATRTRGGFMTLTAGFACAAPPSPGEWRDIEDTHLAWLRIAHVIASLPSDGCVKELAESMPDRATFAQQCSPNMWRG